MKKALKNHLFLWRLCFKAAPGYMIYNIYDGFRLKFFIFIEHVIGIRFCLSCAEHGEPFYKALIGIGIIMLANMIQIIPDAYYAQGMIFRSKPKLYQALKEELYKKAADMDLSCYDDPSYYNDFVLAVAEAETSIDRFLTLLNNAAQSITVLITAGIFFITTDAAGVLFVIVSFVLSFLFSKALNKLKLLVRTRVNPWERKRNYSTRVFYLNDFAKELRQNKKIGVILREQFIEANKQIEAEERNVSRKRTWLMFLRQYCAGDFITDGLYIGYLIFQAAVFHTIDYSTAVVLFNTTGQLRHGLRQFSDLGPMIHENSLFIDKIKNFLSYEPVICHETGISVPKGTGELTLEHVSFRYSPEAEDILQDICLKVKPGEHIAIVGYNGAGKTTLIKLLMRLYDSTEGTISYHGNNIREFDIDEYRHRIGVVFQDYRMFAESLFENVVLDDVEEDAQKSKAVARVLTSSGFAERLNTLDRGLQTPITTEFDEQGVNLSGGESQKVAISRAFYREADILVMDEPSSALDPITEYNLNKAMHDAALHRTVFYISHRLSTTRDADRILMLERGRIIEEGTHDELLARNGKYAAMWNVQAGKYMS